MKNRDHGGQSINVTNGAEEAINRLHRRNSGGGGVQTLSRCRDKGLARLISVVMVVMVVVMMMTMVRKSRTVGRRSSGQRRRTSFGIAQLCGSRRAREGGGRDINGRWWRLPSKWPLLEFQAARSVCESGKGCDLGRIPVGVSSIAVMTVGHLFLFSLVCLFTTLVKHLDIIVQDGCDDGHHIRLDDSSSHIFRPTNPDVDHALEGQVPLPHVHHVLATPLLQYTHQSFYPSIDSQNISDAGRRGSQIGKMVERVDQGKRRGAVKRTAVIQGSGDPHRCLVDIRNTEIDFPHDGG